MVFGVSLEHEWLVSKGGLWPPYMSKCRTAALWVSGFFDLKTHERLSWYFKDRAAGYNFPFKISCLRVYINIKYGLEVWVDQAGFRDWLCRRIVAESRDAIIFADQDGRVRLWNAGAEAMFGYGAAEMEGQTLDLIIPEALRDRHNEGYRRVMASGTSKYAAELLAVPGLRKDGARISLEFTITLIKDDGGAVLGAAAIMRDVTARWQRDQELKKRLAALEAENRSQA